MPHDAVTKLNGVFNEAGRTLGQVARGAGNYDDWYIGFHISRKFY